MRTSRLIVHGAVSAGYALGGAALWLGLPSEIPPSWTAASGEVVWLGGPLVAFLLPTTVAVTYRLLRSLSRTGPIDQHDAALGMLDVVMARVALLVLGVHATILAGLEGWLFGRPWSGQVLPLMLGLAMVSIGNLLPRIRPNLAIGIRTQRTLSDRAYWIRAHRRAGYLVVACGAVVMVSALAVPSPVGPSIILLIAPAAIVGTWLLVRWQRPDVDA
jgi:uncharacterized membrane protein